MKHFKGKRIGILGLGEENVALALFLAKFGYNLTICDRKGREELSQYLEQLKSIKASYRLGEDYLDDLIDFDIVFRTPGLPFLHKKLEQFKAIDREISSQIKLFFDLSPAPIIGITGTKGKGTTTSLVGEILKKAYPKRNIFIAGNIGTPPITFLKKLTTKDLVILELSSFQLQDLTKSPHIAVVLDIKIDHLDVHKDEKEYILAKQNIVKFQKRTDFAVINADYLTSFEFGTLTQAEVFWFSRRKSVDQGAWVKDGKEILLNLHGNKHKICDTKDITLRGEHNWENICAAITASYLAGADLKTISKTVINFQGLEHRLEFVKEVGGVKYYNDSFSTTPDTAISAIQSFSEPIILIAGGSEKNADYSKLGKTISESNIKTVIHIGVTGPRIKKEINSKDIKIIDTCQNMTEVFEVVSSEAKAGDVVLLSPASASFDWFKNYKDRGNQFKEQVKNGHV